MRPRRLSLEVLRQALRERAGVTAAELAARLRVSQSTVSRGLAALGGEVARIGQTRSARYALARSVGRHGSQWPLHRIDDQGRPEFLGTLQALHGGAWFFDSHLPRSAWLTGEFRQGLFPDLPWFLEDLRPQGFLGRTFVLAYARDLDAPEDLNIWRSDHVLAALLRHGDNLPGNLVLGEEALTQALHDIVEPREVIDLADRADQFLRRADAALRGRPVGSSAGGEQPKFTALVLEAPGHYRSTVVKFSEPVASSASAERWADLLRCEHLASQALQAAGIAAAETQTMDVAGRRFLQSTRFDRTPTLGRRGHVTLRALDAAYLGRGREPWTQMADRLLAQEWIAPECAETIRTLGLFGELIGNTDMHFGNLAFELRDATPFGLVPAYDMLPMLYAPTSGGALVERTLNPTVPLPRLQSAWARAAHAARDFWQTVEADGGISDGFRRLASANGQSVARWLARFG